MSQYANFFAADVLQSQQASQDSILGADISYSVRDLELKVASHVSLSGVKSLSFLVVYDSDRILFSTGQFVSLAQLSLSSSQSGFLHVILTDLNQVQTGESLVRMPFIKRVDGDIGLVVSDARVELDDESILSLSIKSEWTGESF